MTKAIAGLLCTLGLSLLVVGCGSGAGGEGDRTGEIRFLHASPDAFGFNILVDDLVVASNIAYSTDTPYFPVDEGSRRIRFNLIDGTRETTVIDIAVEIKDDFDYTIVASDFTSILKPLVLEDDNTGPETDEFKIRFINLAPSAGVVDLFFVREADDFLDADPKIYGAEFLESLDYAEFSGTEYNVTATIAGTKFIIAEAGSIRFNDEKVYTITLLESRGGGAPYQLKLTVDRD